MVTDRHIPTGLLLKPWQGAQAELRNLGLVESLGLGAGRSTMRVVNFVSRRNPFAKDRPLGWPVGCQEDLHDA